MGKILRFYLLAFLLVFVAQTRAQIPDDYWAGTEGLTGDSLKNKVSEIINTNVHYVTYTPGVWDAYAGTDVYPKPSDTIVWDIYGDTSLYKYVIFTDQCGTYTQEGDCYNREHSFPKSWFGGSTDPGPGTDLHHVFASDGYVNSKRSNYPYGEVDAANATYVSMAGNMLGPSAIPDTNITFFEPVDKYKGDVARALFYMAVMYKDSIPSWVQEYGGETDIDVVFLPDGRFRPWYYEMMYKWNLEDPVSQKELARNDSIYNIQGNANPFVEHPEWVCKIFGSCVPSPENLTAQAYSQTQILLNWTLNADNDSVVLAYNTVNTFGTPDGQYKPGDTIPGGGIVIYVGKDTTFLHEVNSYGVYYYQLWAYDSIEGYSTGISTWGSPLKGEPAAYPAEFSATALSASQIQASWSVASADGYVVEISRNNTFITPVDGQPLSDDTDISDGFGLLNVPGTDTLVIFTGLDPETTYYLTIYPYNNAGTNVDYLTAGTAPVASATTLNQCATDLIISEYGEGSGNNKFLEIYNATGQTVDLSQYRVGLVFNGGEWTESTISFPDGAVLPDGETYLIVNSQADQALLDKADLTTGSLSFNGDDAVALQKLVNGTWVNLDQIGTDGDDPGSGWDVAGVSNATADHTLVRKAGVNKPTTDWAASAGTNAENSQWIVYPADTWDYIGSHQVVCLTCEPAAGPADLTFNALDEGSFTLSWNKSDAEKYIVLVRAGSQVTSQPYDGETYDANAQLGQGYQFTDGSYVVYNDTGSTVTVTGAEPGTVYYVSVFGYSCTPPNYLTSSFASGIANSRPLAVAINAECTDDDTQAQLSWEKPQGQFDYVLVFGLKDQVPPAPQCIDFPEPDSNFANAPVYCDNALGAKLVYKGTGSSVTVTGLESSNYYYFATAVVLNGVISANVQYDSVYTEVSTSTGVDDLHGFAVYPNPVSDRLIVSLPGEQFDMEIYSLTGVKVIQKLNINGQAVLDMNGLSQGIYILKVSTQDKVLYSRIVKE